VSNESCPPNGPLVRITISPTPAVPDVNNAGGAKFPPSPNPANPTPSDTNVTAFPAMFEGSAIRNNPPGCTVTGPVPNGVPVRVKLATALVAVFCAAPQITVPKE
jgi:hypothetical protein